MGNKKRNQGTKKFFPDGSQDQPRNNNSAGSSSDTGRSQSDQQLRPLGPLGGLGPQASYSGHHVASFNPRYRGPPPNQFVQQGPSPQRFRGPSPRSGAPLGQQAYRDTQPRQHFSSPGSRYSSASSQPSTSQQARLKHYDSQKRSEGIEGKPFNKWFSPADMKRSSEKQLDSGIKTEVGKMVSRSSSVQSVSSSDQALIPRRTTLKHSNQYFESEKGYPVQVNYLRIDFDEKKSKSPVYQYAVSFSPEKRKTLYRTALEAFLRKYTVDGNTGFDGKSLLFALGTKLRFPNGRDSFSGSIEVSHQDSSRPMCYNISIQLTREINYLQLLIDYMKNGSSLSPCNTQALDVILNHAPINNLEFIKAGRSFFSCRQRAIAPLGNGMELRCGYQQSIIIPWLNETGFPHLYLNVDVAHKGFPTGQPVLEYLRNEFFQNPRYPLNPNSFLNDRQKRIVLGYLKGLKVEYQMNGLKMQFKVESFDKSARQHRFKLEGTNSEITVEEYFRRQKNYIIQFPNLPCIGRKQSMFPLELCCILPNQVVSKPLTDKQKGIMVSKTASSTLERKQKIEQSLQRIDFANDPCMREAGLRLSNEFETVNAYVLKPPHLQYSQKIIPVKDGEWQNDDKFIQSVHLKKWVVINTDAETDVTCIRNIVGKFRSIGPSLGIEVSEPIIDKLQDPTEGDFVSKFQQYKNQSVQLICVLLNETDKFMHNKVKIIGDQRVGILTQCIRAKNVKQMPKKLDSIVKHIFIKLNAKLNGINHTLEAALRPEILKEDIMFVGADVTHPPAHTREISVAAVTASHDEYGFQYNLQLNLQPSGKEIILNLEEMIMEQLKFYQNANSGKIPKRILYYRDGVSDGYFQEVLDVELTALKRACASFSKDPITITFIIVQKRHRTRFFPGKENSDGTKNFNVKVGTLVDEKITHPTEIEFYLVSHRSIQGTARPTRFKVLHDENFIDQETLERLTFYLCHLYARCDRSVSYPAPTYYAHLGAFRGKTYWHRLNNASERDLKRYQEQSGQIASDLKANNPMHFI